MNEPPLQIDFWNVGQGDSSTILRPDGSMDVIDVGPVNTPQLCDYLSAHTHTINALVLTHNDEDHVGALPTLLAIPNIVVRKVYLLDDKHNMPKIVGMLIKSIPKKCIYRIENRDREQVIDQFEGYKLKVKYPIMAENILSTTPNQTSAIISLEKDRQNVIVWASDNRISTVSEKIVHGASMLFGPHHGAPEDIKSKHFSSNLSTLSPKQCFLSFGHKNKYHHPNAKYIIALKQIGCHVICSQRCTNCKLGRNTLDFNGDAIYGLKPPSKSVPCHGHVRLFVNGTSVIDDLEQEYKKAKIKIKNRLCC